MNATVIKIDMQAGTVTTSQRPCTDFFIPRGKRVEIAWLDGERTEAEEDIRAHSALIRRMLGMAS